MGKYFAVLAALSTTGALAQTAQPATTGAQPQAQTQAQPQTVKKRVCTRAEETGSRVGGGKVCKIVEVPAKATSTDKQQHPQDHGAHN